MNLVLKDYKELKKRILENSINFNKVFILKNELNTEKIKYEEFCKHENLDVINLNYLIANINNIQLDIEQLDNEIKLQKLNDKIFMKKIQKKYHFDQIKSDISDILALNKKTKYEL